MIFTSVMSFMVRRDIWSWHNFEKTNVFHWSFVAVRNCQHFSFQYSCLSFIALWEHVVFPWFGGSLGTFFKWYLSVALFTCILILLHVPFLLRYLSTISWYKPELNCNIQLHVILWIILSISSTVSPLYIMHVCTCIYDHINFIPHGICSVCEVYSDIDYMKYLGMQKSMECWLLKHSRFDVE